MPMNFRTSQSDRPAATMPSLMASSREIRTLWLIHLSCSLLSAHLRASTAKAVSAKLFNDVLPPESYADLFDDLAWKLRNRILTE
jgi:hypothetical protein